LAGEGVSRPYLDHNDGRSDGKAREAKESPGLRCCARQGGKPRSGTDDYDEQAEARTTTEGSDGRSESLILRRKTGGTRNGCGIGAETEDDYSRTPIATTHLICRSRLQSAVPAAICCTWIRPTMCDDR